MNILITGGTGFIGKVLCQTLQDEHNIVLITRYPKRVQNGLRAFASLDELDDTWTFDVIINLAGEPIANKRWSDEQKKRIVSSRLGATQKIIDFIKRVKQKPKLLLSGSAIGIYGLGVDDKPVHEDAAGDQSFSSTLCDQWEAEAFKARDLGVRTCVLRTGIVLGKNGGALKKMLAPFKLGLGGRIGDGSQWMPWIHMDDLIGIILYCINNANINGPVNLTAPNPVRNDLFVKSLARTLNRPAFLPLPKRIVELLMGQMGSELLLSGKRVLPDKIIKAGYQFTFQRLDEALSNILGKNNGHF